MERSFRRSEKALTQLVASCLGRSDRVDPSGKGFGGKPVKAAPAFVLDRFLYTLLL